jgi:hypothetical protein
MGSVAGTIASSVRTFRWLPEPDQLQAPFRAAVRELAVPPFWPRFLSVILAAWLLAGMLLGFVQTSATWMGLGRLQSGLPLWWLLVVIPCGLYAVESARLLLGRLASVVASGKLDLTPSLEPTTVQSGWRFGRPVRRQQLIALLGGSVLAALCLGLWWLGHRLTGEPPDWRASGLLPSGQLLLVLVAGLAFGWRFPRLGRGWLCLVLYLVSLGPWLLSVASGWLWSAGDRVWLGWGIADWLFFATQAGLIALCWMWSYRLGLDYLALGTPPIDAPQADSLPVESLPADSLRADSLRADSLRAARASAVATGWQSEERELTGDLVAAWWRVRGLVVVAGGCLLLSLGVAFFALDAAWPDLMPAAVLLGILGVGWLGSAAFWRVEGENRPLASGAPVDGPGLGWRQWWLRQAPPMAVLGIALVGFAGLALVRSTQGWPGGINNALPIMGAFFSMVAVNYAAAQWVAQQTPSRLLSLFMAPAAAGLSVNLSLLAYFDLGCSWWVLWLWTAIALFATRLGLSVWQTGIGRWSGHGVQWTLLAVCAILPLLEVQAGVWRQPTMSPAVAAQLQRAMDEAPRAPFPDPLGLPPLSIESARDSSLESQWRERLEAVAQLLATAAEADPGDAVATSPELMGLLMGIAELTRPGEEQLGAPEIHAQAVGLLGNLAQRLRASPRVADQEAADTAEMWLIDLLAVTPPALLAELPRDCPRWLPQLIDQEHRSQARRRAVVASWSAYLESRWQAESRLVVTLGGVQFLQMQYPIPTWRESAIAHRRLALAVEKLWLAAAAESDQRGPELVAAVERAWGAPPGWYAVRPDAVAWGVDRNLRRLRQHIFHHRWPGTAWYADWESQAAVKLNAWLALMPEREDADGGKVSQRWSLRPAATDVTQRRGK